MRRVAIVQARHNSSRLPGKVLRDLGGKPMLARVLARLRRATTLDEVALATSTDVSDDAVASLGIELGVRVVRGSEHDVLARYALALRETEADVIVRVTADCPLIDPALVDEVVSAFGEPPWQCDFAANTLERTYPRGLDVEVTHREAMLRADEEAREPYERAHVMPYLYTHPESFRLRSVRGSRDRSALRWTVDTLEDFALVERIYAAFRNEDTFSWTEALAIVESTPELARMNAAIAQKALAEG